MHSAHEAKYWSSTNTHIPSVHFMVLYVAKSTGPAGRVDAVEADMFPGVCDCFDILLPKSRRQRWFRSTSRMLSTTSQQMSGCPTTV